MRNHSLKLKLLKTIMAILLLGWLTWLVCEHLQLSRQQSRHGDLMLREVAEQILLSMPRDIAGVASSGHLQLPADRPAAALHKFDKLQFQVWSLASRERVVASQRAPAAALKPDFQPGFGHSRSADEQWRVYAVSDAEGRVQVQAGLAQSQMQAELGYWVKAGLVYALGALLALAGAIWLAVHWSLRPIDRLRGDMGRREPLDLTPLPTVGITREILPLVESFNALLARLGEAMQAERQFLADAAHEIRTPLAALLTQAELALRADAGADAQRALQRLAGGIERTSRLAQQLLDSARLEASQRSRDETPVELAEVATMVAREFEGMASRRRQTLAVTASETPVCGNLDDLGILVRNLVDNAVRHAGDGARIEIDCHAVAGGHALLCVRDNGPGVVEAERERIFERFFRGSNGNGERGSGIGLSLVARIAGRHRATLRVGDGIGGRGLGISVAFPLLDLPR
ncbi:ATP-binding protein [Flavobacterium sp. MXW15]|uniref:histidine kinase n=1 Tax=Xanthomonas chitinilytica TaxID=2989819 RepID=A0ABT3JYZ4_9XANT|nr:ATP-binding protein [Xanthomonas sp. H13-6]MCW4456074.1 ATP-binding protein [Flavobacterium sp. MXW15]MCW4473671.1 ATP-binding protein [Xanthomonas sp. H13-6]